MEWNVLWYDFDSDKICGYNILSHYESTIKKLKNKCLNKNNFAEELKTEMMYKYWSRSEYEIIIKPWIGNKKDTIKKIDIWYQINLNWDNFVDYCWNYHHKYQKK